MYVWAGEGVGVSKRREGSHIYMYVQHTYTFRVPLERRDGGLEMPLGAVQLADVPADFLDHGLALRRALRDALDPPQQVRDGRLHVCVCVCVCVLGGGVWRCFGSGVSEGESSTTLYAYTSTLFPPPHHQHPIVFTCASEMSLVACSPALACASIASEMSASSAPDLFI